MLYFTHPPGKQRLWYKNHLGLSTTCQLISALCVCSWDSSKAQCTEEPRALPVYGREKHTDTWEGRRGVWRSKKAGKFPGGNSRLANKYSPMCQIALQRSMVAGRAANRCGLWLYSPVMHKRGTRCYFVNWITGLGRFVCCALPSPGCSFSLPTAGKLLCGDSGVNYGGPHHHAVLNPDPPVADNLTG